ncbi:FAD binding domain protein [Xylariaceae sp. FL0255]|nr:FAD binding domain protein [Xylariaceae sp. FL0255]
MHSALLASTALLLGTVACHPQQCKTIPGDKNWPNTKTWTALNSTVNGRLIATVPLASVCHTAGPFSSYYNASACDTLQGLWDYSQVHFQNPASIMAGWFTQSCDPFSPADDPCELGNYASYSIEVKGVNDIIAGIKFAKENNVRLVIKNTGHDETGKSTGTGSLSLWMHKLKDKEIISKYKSGYYTGPAIKIGAGVLGLEAYETANAAGYRVVGGNCPSVGIAGGYSQGGGHSLLGSTYGMAADNILEWEVITSDYRHIIATPTNNTDLYWALSGGGGGTYGVVVSMTARLHPDGPIGGGYLSFDNTTVGTDKFWDAVGVFNAKLPSMLGAGNITIAYSLIGNAFDIYNIGADGRTAAEVRAILNPFLKELDSMGVPYNCTTHQTASFLDTLRADYSPFPDGPFTTSGLLGSRLIPITLLQNSKSNDNLTQILRETESNGDFAMLMQALDVGSAPVKPVADNAVLPAWRETAIQLILSATWEWDVPFSQMEQYEDIIADKLIPQLLDLTPGSGSYLNEATFRQKDWQTAFFGSNYNKLLKIKNKYDSDGLFYALQAVGSEAWAEDSNGRLCRT